MKVLILSVAALVVPLVWGWLIFRLLRAVWPESDVPAAEHGTPPGPPPGSLMDYQI
ncbi:MAG: hypothetical protein AB7K24_17080 [Gemmataceae bacterium]